VVLPHTRSYRAPTFEHVERLDVLLGQFGPRRLLYQPDQAHPVSDGASFSPTIPNADVDAHRKLLDLIADFDSMTDTVVAADNGQPPRIKGVDVALHLMGG
jgi:hypothetical protein